MTKVDFKFSPIIIGTMRLGSWGAALSSQQLEYFIDQCLDLGLRDFDHADIYGDYTEEGHFGQVISRRPDLKAKIQITTKCGIKMISSNRPNHKIKSYNSSKDHIIRSAENSLKELNVDHIDLLLIHRPDYLMNPQEVAEAFHSLQSAGKVRAFGVSNFTIPQLELLKNHFPIVTNQIEASILHRDPFEDGMLFYCMQHHIVPTIWSPFGGGKIFTSSDEAEIQHIQKTAQDISKKYDATIDQILLAWLLAHPSGMIPIIGSSKIERIKRALDATTIKITREEWYELWQAAKGEAVA